MNSRITPRRAGIGLAAVLAIAGGSWLLASSGSADRDTVAAAQAFLASLSAQQRSRALLEFSMPLRAQWHFIPKPERKGLPIGQMSPQQRALAQRLLQTTLSQIGYDKAQQIMRLEAILRALEPQRPPEHRDPQRYYFALFGSPDAQSRWQWSVEGHHLSLNFVVERGRVIAHTPAFFGANPALVKSDVGVGPPPGTRVLAREESLAFELLGTLSAEQAAQCVIADKAPRDIRAGGQPQPPQEPPQGIPAAQLDARQKELLLALIGVYVGNMSDDIAAPEWQSIRGAGVEKIHFAWAGARAPGVGHYYRIQGPTFLVELCNTQADVAGNPANHVHTVYRRLPRDFAADTVP